MKTQLLVILTTLSFSCFGFAETITNTTATKTNGDLKPLNGVRVSMQRMVKSNEGRYFMSLYAGINKPHGVLYDLVDNKAIHFNGVQKGDQLNLKSENIDAETAESYQLSGILNANTGLFKALLSDKNSTLGKSIQFEPAFKVTNKPVFIFKFYGKEDSNSPYGKALKRIDVVNKNNNLVVQSLTGFTGYPNSVGYMDINFDGYYDVLVSDVSNGRAVDDKRYIYWMYNPKTQQFQRSPQLEKVVGLPNLHGEKRQIDFGNGQLYQVDNGLLIKVSQESQ